MLERLSFIDLQVALGRASLITQIILRAALFTWPSL